MGGWKQAIAWLHWIDDIVGVRHFDEYDEYVATGSRLPEEQ